MRPSPHEEGDRRRSGCRREVSTLALQASEDAEHSGSEYGDNRQQGSMASDKAGGVLGGCGHSLGQ